VRYRLRVWRLETDPGNGEQWWGGWVSSSATHRDTFIGAIRVPADHRTISGPLNFTEYFGPAACPDVPQTVVVWFPPAANSYGDDDPLRRYGRYYEPAGQAKGHCSRA
jgi:hypothetical protein